MTRDGNGRTWRVRSRQHDFEWVGPLVAYWEVNLDPMSDDYTPSEIDAEELLRKWARQARERHPDEMIPIYWFVDSPGQGKFERMPHQPTRNAGGTSLDNDFLTFYTRPVDSNTDQRLVRGDVVL